MDNNTVIVIGIFALILIVAFVAFSKRVKADIRGPLNTKLSLDASNPEPTPGASVKDARSHGGAVRADDLTGRGATVERAEARGDITATSRPQGDDPDPKA